MKKYSFSVKVSKESEIFPGREYQPKGFYYQGMKKQYVILVGNEASGDTTRIKLFTDHVNITVSEDK